MDVPGRRQSRVDTSAMLRISWTERTSNEYILRDIRPPQRLSSTVCSRELTFFGYIIRASNMEKLNQRECVAAGVPLIAEFTPARRR